MMCLAKTATPTQKKRSINMSHNTFITEVITEKKTLLSLTCKPHMS